MLKENAYCRAIQRVVPKVFNELMGDIEKTYGDKLTQEGKNALNGMKKYYRPPNQGWFDPRLVYPVNLYEVLRRCVARQFL